MILMKKEDLQSLVDLVQRGKDIQNKIEQLRGTQGFTSLIDFIGRLATGRLDPDDRELGHNLRTASVQLLSSPLLTLKQEYQEWYMDCRTFFAKMEWMSQTAVKAFLETGNTSISKETKITVEMVVKRQLVLLEKILSSPPKQYNVAKAAFVIVYVASCLFLDVILFAFIGLATIPVAAFQVGLLLAFPRIEEWIRNF
jgi:hypothetical protein